MPRQARLNIAGAIYHVITRGIERREIFKDEEDREEFLIRLGEGIKKVECRCYGWALMSNHIHLIIGTGTKSLSELMKRVLTGYAIYFNKKHKRRGYLFQNRYKSILCQEEVYLLELVRYWNAGGQKRIFCCAAGKRNILMNLKNKWGYSKVTLS